MEKKQSEKDGLLKQSCQISTSHLHPGAILFARTRKQPFYVAKIINVDTVRSRCYARFEDDTTHWCSFDDIQKPFKSDDRCCLCNVSAENLSDLIECTECQLRFHRTCHNPAVDGEHSGDWKCNVCVYRITGAKREVFEKKLKKIQNKSNCSSVKSSSSAEEQRGLACNPPESNAEQNTFSNRCINRKRSLRGSSETMQDGKRKLSSRLNKETSSTSSVSFLLLDDFQVDQQISSDSDFFHEEDYGEVESDDSFKLSDSDESEVIPLKERFLNTSSNTTLNTGQLPDSVPTAASDALILCSAIQRVSEVIHHVECDFSSQYSSNMNIADLQASGSIPSEDLHVGNMNLDKMPRLEEEVDRREVYDQCEPLTVHHSDSNSCANIIEQTRVSKDFPNYRNNRLTRECAKLSFDCSENNENTQETSHRQHVDENYSTVKLPFVVLQQEPGKKFRKAKVRLLDNKKQCYSSEQNTCDVDIINSLKYHKSVVPKNIIEAACVNTNSSVKLERTVSNYFGSYTRLSNDASCKIRGCRIGTDGSIQYLVEWFTGTIL